MKPWPSLLLISILAAAGARAGDDRLFLAGGEVGEAAWYAYTGLILPVHHDGQATRLVQRWWLDAFGYEYDGATGRVEADAWGGEAALGYRLPVGSGWSVLSVGVRHTDTGLSPDDPGATARGRQTGIKLQIERDLPLTSGWVAGFIGSWTTTQDSYWGRVRLTRPHRAGHARGAELVIGGNDESRATAFGLLWSLPLGRSASGAMTLRGGYRAGDGDGAYVGIEYGRPF